MVLHNICILQDDIWHFTYKASSANKDEDAWQFTATGDSFTRKELDFGTQPTSFTLMVHPDKRGTDPDPPVQPVQRKDQVKAAKQRQEEIMAGLCPSLARARKEKLAAAALARALQE